MKKNAGNSLIELVVCVSMFTLLCMAALGFFSYTVNMFAKATAESERIKTCGLIDRAFDSVAKRGENVRTEKRGEREYIVSEIDGRELSVAYDRSSGAVILCFNEGGDDKDITLADNISNWELKTGTNLIKATFTVENKSMSAECEIVKMCDMAPTQNQP